MLESPKNPTNQSGNRYQESKVTYSDIANSTDDSVRITKGEKSSIVEDVNERLEKLRTTSPKYAAELAKVQGREISQPIPVDQYSGEQTAFAIMAVISAAQLPVKNTPGIDSTLLGAIAKLEAQTTPASKTSPIVRPVIKPAVENVEIVELQKALNGMLAKYPELRSQALKENLIPPNRKNPVAVDGIVGKQTNGTIGLIKKLGLTQNFKTMQIQQRINERAESEPGFLAALQAKGISNGKGFLVEDGLYGKNTREAGELEREYDKKQLQEIGREDQIVEAKVPESSQTDPVHHNLYNHPIAQVVFTELSPPKSSLEIAKKFEGLSMPLQEGLHANNPYDTASSNQKSMRNEIVANAGYKLLNLEGREVYVHGTEQFRKMVETSFIESSKEIVEITSADRVKHLVGMGETYISENGSSLIVSSNPIISIDENQKG